MKDFVEASGERPKELSIEDGLREIYNPSFSVLGHGTNQGFGEVILEEGLEAKQPDILFTSVPLFDYSKSFDEQKSNVESLIRNWPHHNLKSIVVVSLPNPDEGEVGGSYYFNSFFKEIGAEEEGASSYENGYILPSEYIRGFFDIENNRFVVNPSYNPLKPKKVIR